MAWQVTLSIIFPQIIEFENFLLQIKIKTTLAEKIQVIGVVVHISNFIFFKCYITNHHPTESHIY